MSVAKNSTAANAAKRLARLAAVQALYQALYNQQSPTQIVSDSINSGFSFLRDGESDKAMDMETPDRELFRKIVVGASAQRCEIEEMIAKALDARLSSERIEKLLQTILCAGIYELQNHPDIPTGVIINDYVDVAHAFYDGKEPGLVNGILDKLARNLRGQF